jgi:hypothetical protein
MDMVLYSLHGGKHMSEVEYVVVPDDEDFDPRYVPDPEEDDAEVSEHAPIPEDLSDFE